MLRQIMNLKHITYCILIWLVLQDPDILLEKQILKLNDFNDMIHQTINKTVLYENSYRFFS